MKKMFKEQNDNESYNEEDIETVIGDSVSLEGNFSSQGSISINGAISGKVSTEKNIDVGSEAKVKGELVGNNIIVAGRVEGNIKAQRLEIKENGEVDGDIDAKVLSIVEGAHFSGQCSMGQEGGKEASANKTQKKVEDTPEREQ
jgi:cytoskeletal protein CcmA (bactofilin family)